MVQIQQVYVFLIDLRTNGLSAHKTSLTPTGIYRQQMLKISYCIWVYITNYLHFFTVFLSFKVLKLKNTVKSANSWLYKHK